MTPVITKMEVYPVAGRDCMELNLSGAHAPYFTRNVVILTDSTGNVGVGEVPGGKKITAALEECIDLVVGTSIAEYKNTLIKVIFLLKLVHFSFISLLFVQTKHNHTIYKSIYKKQLIK